MRLANSPFRKELFNLVYNAKNPINASQIFEKLTKDVALSTVYRGLQYLEEEGVIESFSPYCDICGKDRYFVIAGNEHIHHLHCEKCHSFTAIHGCGTNLDALEKQYHFKIKKHILHFSGICQNCMVKNS